MSTFKERLINSMSAANLSASKLALTIGVVPQTVYDWINEDKNVDPAVSRVLPTAKALGVDAAWLAWGLDPRPEEKIDEEFFVEVVKAFDEALAASKASLPSDKRARAYLLIYKMYKTTGSLDSSAIRSMVDLTR